MSATAVDTSYRAWSIATLEAVKLSTLTQMKAVEGMGQSHSANGRQTALADLSKLVATLNNIENALAWKRNCEGNNGFASRIANFDNCY